MVSSKCALVIILDINREREFYLSYTRKLLYYQSGYPSTCAVVLTESVMECFVSGTEIRPDGKLQSWFDKSFTEAVHRRQNKYQTGYMALAERIQRLPI